MRVLPSLASISEIRAVVIADHSGSLHDAVGGQDNEAVAAIMGFIGTTMNQAGELLGFGPVQRMTVTSPSQAWVVTVKGSAIVGVIADASTSLANLEKKLDSALHDA